MDYEKKETSKLLLEKKIDERPEIMQILYIQRSIFSISFNNDFAQCVDVFSSSASMNEKQKRFKMFNRLISLDDHSSAMFLLLFDENQ